MNVFCCVAMSLVILVPFAWHAAAQDPSQNQPGMAGDGPPVAPFPGFYNSSIMIPRPVPPAQRDSDSMMAADVVTTVLTGNSSQPVLTPIYTFESAEDFDKEKELMLREAGCRMACQDHGHCDDVTKYCICEYFWTQNPFRIHYHRYESNCDWNVFVVIGTLIGIAFGLLLLSILCHACCRRGASDKPYRRYRLLPDDDMEGFGAVGAGMRKPKRVRAQLVDSDDDSETVFEAKNPKYYAQKLYGAGEAVKAK